MIELSKKYYFTFIKGRPQHPQSQGCIERIGGNFINKLNKAYIEIKDKKKKIDIK